MFIGVDGQYVYVVPSLELIVVRNSLYNKYDGPAVADPSLITRNPLGGLFPGRGTIGPSDWSHGDFMGHVIDSIQ